VEEPGVAGGRRAVVTSKAGIRAEQNDIGITVASERQIEFSVTRRGASP
jgi:hypothetical protein